MRILMYADWHLPYSGKLAKELAQRDHKVWLFIRDHDFEFAGRSEDREQFLVELQNVGVSIRVITGRHWSTRTGLQTPWLAREWKSLRPDVIHLQQNSDPRLLLAISAAPTVLTVHEPYLRPGDVAQRGLAAPLRTGLSNFYLRRADGIIVHTVHHEDYLMNRGLRNVTVIPHGVRFRETMLETPAIPQILHFGRAAAYKGLDILLDAVVKVRQVIPRVSLRVLCSGGRPQGLAEPQGSWYQASWDGYSEKELDTALKAASVVALPYKNAAGSGAASTAVGSGVPIVTTPFEGLSQLTMSREQICAIEDPNSLAQAIMKVLGWSDDKRRQMWNCASDTFSWATTARRHEQLYRAIANPSNKRS